jgi:hypothetical protein
MLQCHARGIALGPLASFNRWKELGRYVRKGERPSSSACPSLASGPSKPYRCGQHATEDERFTASSSAQLVRAELRRRAMPTCHHARPWDRTRALATLNVTEIPFDLPDGNCQGFARGRSIAVSPIAANPEDDLPRDRPCHHRPHGRGRTYATMSAQPRNLVTGSRGHR